MDPTELESSSLNTPEPRSVGFAAKPADALMTGTGREGVTVPAGAACGRAHTHKHIHRADERTDTHEQASVCGYLEVGEDGCRVQEE